MLFKRKLICLVLSILSFASTDNTLASHNDLEQGNAFEETLEKIKQVCPVLKTPKFPQGVPLPTEEDLQLIEEKFSKLPPQLEQFLKDYGNLKFRVFDLARAYRTKDMSESGFSKINHKFRKLTNLPDFLAFCHDNGNYFCIDLKESTVRYWQHDKEEFSHKEADCWPSFNDWLNRVFLPHQRI